MDTSLSRVELKIRTWMETNMPVRPDGSIYATEQNGIDFEAFLRSEHIAARVVVIDGRFEFVK